MWLNGRNKPILTTMMLAGHRWVRVHGFGVQRQIFSPTVIVWAVFVDLETEDMCGEEKTLVVPEGSILLATAVFSRIAGLMKEKFWALVRAWPNFLLDERVLRVQRDSAGNAVVDLVQLLWVGGSVSSLRTFCRAANLSVNMHGIIWFTTTEAFGSSVNCHPQTLLCKNTSSCARSVGERLAA